MALFRALESLRLRPAGSRLFDDPYAHLFLTEWRQRAYEIGRLRWGRWLVERLFDQAAPGAREAGIARTKWIDDQATEALKSAAQLVLLGAGFDTRAFRLPAAAQAITFELDHSETSAAKQAKLKKTMGTIPERIRFVAIDFNRQSLADVLTHAGFDKTRPACFIWEGVTNYLTAGTVDSALRQIRQIACAGILLFTYIDRDVLDHPDQFFGAARTMARVRSYGEPWTFGLQPGELADYLAARGFRLITDVGVGEVWERTGRSRAGTRGYEFYRLASVRPAIA